MGGKEEENDMEEYLEDDEEALNKETNSEEDTYGEEFVTAEDIEEPSAKRQKKK